MNLDIVIGVPLSFLLGAEGAHANGALSRCRMGRQTDRADSVPVDRSTQPQTAPSRRHDPLSEEHISAWWLMEPETKKPTVSRAN